MIFPRNISDHRKRVIIPRKTSVLMKNWDMFSGLFASLIEGSKSFISTLSALSYSKGISYVRLFQWLGLIDAFEKNSPYKTGLKSIDITLNPIGYILATANELKIEEKTCLAPFLSYIMPTPYRQVLKYSLNAISLEKVAEAALEKGLPATRVIALNYLQQITRETDLYRLIMLGYSSGFIRPGKKSDPGKKIAYLRVIRRGDWAEHSCNSVLPPSGKYYLELEKMIIGGASKNIEKIISLPSKVKAFLADLKILFPYLARFYNDYFSFRHPDRNLYTMLIKRLRERQQNNI
jgi:hypothetical protein